MVSKTFLETAFPAFGTGCWFHIPHINRQSYSIRIGALSGGLCNSYFRSACSCQHASDTFFPMPSTSSIARTLRDIWLKTSTAVGKRRFSTVSLNLHGQNSILLPSILFFNTGKHYLLFIVIYEKLKLKAVFYSRRSNTFSY